MALDKASRAEEACSWFKGLISYNPNTDSGIMGNIHKQLLHIVHIQLWNEKKIKQHYYFIKDGLNTSFEWNVIWHSITFQDFHILLRKC